MNEIKFKKLKEQDREKYYKNKLNLDIADKKHKRSYYNLSNKFIKIEVLTPNDKFDFKGLFHIVINSKIYLLVHISDNTPTSTRNLDSAWLMRMKLPFTSIENCESTPIKIPKGTELNVLVYNDDKTVLCDEVDDIIKNSKKNNSTEKDVRPNEVGGGGVIIEGP